MKFSEYIHVIASRVKPKIVMTVMLLSMGSASVLTSHVANAAVYKKVDADGNVTFTDVPDKNAQQITVAPLSTVPAMSPELISSTLGSDQNTPTEESAVNYTITIISPMPDQTYRRGSESFSVNVQVKPDLRQGDRLITLVDGNSGSGGSTQDMDRGQHQFEAKIINKNGRVLTSQSVSFYVQQSNAKQQGYVGKLPVGKK